MKSSFRTLNFLFSIYNINNAKLKKGYKTFRVMCQLFTQAVKELMSVYYFNNYFLLPKFQGIMYCHILFAFYHYDPKFFGQTGLGKQCRPRLD